MVYNNPIVMRFVVVSTLWLCLIALSPKTLAEGLFDLDFTAAQIQNMEFLEREYSLDTDLLMTAVNFASNYQEGVTQNNILTIIDYRMPSFQKRMWVVDIETMEIVYGRFKGKEREPLHQLVAHGRKSGDELYAKTFSNISNSNQSSLGFFRTAETYKGKHGYSMRIDGLEAKHNSLARKRFIVVHGAEYMTQKWMKQNNKEHPGQSYGTIAIDPGFAKSYIDTVKKGSLIFAYHPSYGPLLDSSFVTDTW